MADEDQFVTGESGASLTVPVQAGALKKGHMVLINGFPCKVVDISISKTGKHGHAKASITALDIFTNKKYEDQAPTSHNLEQPVVKSTEYTLCDITEDGMVSLMNEAGDIREDLEMPKDDEVAVPMKEAFDAGKEVQCRVVAAMGKEVIMGFKSKE